MRPLSIQESQVVVLPEDDSPGGRGGLFERFLAQLLHSQYGFEDPQTKNLNVTSEGIELDVVAEHRLTGSSAIAECKAYSRNVKASELTNFYGKLTIERFEDPDAFGVLCALPRLTPEGQEKARAIQSKDSKFRYLSADDLALELLHGGLIANPPGSIGDSSDRAVLITEHGVYAACITLDAGQRTPNQVAVWAVSGNVPGSVLALLANSEYAAGLPVIDAGVSTPTVTPFLHAPVLLTPVIGSSSDFEYQLPASPKYFVGRTASVRRLQEEVLTLDRGGVLVLNAQSGWGKSSLALKLADVTERHRGVALILDTRTADQPRYVVEVLRQVGLLGEAEGILTLPSSASWASLESALATLRNAVWQTPTRPLVVFFDQFENVFRDTELTRAFRDLALGSRDIPGPLTIGYAWKTDLVGWTEGNPYQLRDDIRGAGTVLTVEPFGAREVDVLLSRLAKEAGVRLLPDLRSRLRAYSQGLPWLLKKLADHVLRQLKGGETQEGLLAESLNVVALFEADLAELGPPEQMVLRHVARFAPIPAVEVTERFGPASVQSLVDRRLVVQVGDRLDTYWDTFRDFLNTGSVPVQESWILRQTPRSVARLLPLVVAAGGDVSVKSLVEQLDTSDRAIFNLTRELRLLGVTAQEPNRVRLVPEVINALDREAEMRRRVGSSLRRHRAYSTLRRLAERGGGSVSLDGYARELPNAFPAVAVAANAWSSYARAFLFWMEYAGLVVREAANYLPTPDATSIPSMKLLAAPSPLKYRSSVPQIAPGRALDLLKRLHAQGTIALPSSSKEREAAGTLFALGAITVSPAGTVELSDQRLVKSDGSVDPQVLLSLLVLVPGGAEGIATLEQNPEATPKEVGETIRDASGASWKDPTTKGVGGYFRSWAKLAGLTVTYPRRP